MRYAGRARHGPGPAMAVGQVVPGLGSVLAFSTRPARALADGPVSGEMARSIVLAP